MTLEEAKKELASLTNRWVECPFHVESGCAACLGRGRIELEAQIVDVKCEEDEREDYVIAWGAPMK